ncbi:MAG: caspase family protein, partial [Pseudomonadota bacterium]
MDRFRRIAWIFLTAGLMVSTLAAPSQESRFAFVIGNDDYAETPLPVAARDASLMADTLKAAGFDVIGARNLDSETLRTAFREFLDKIAAAGPQSVAAIYLSGYGLQFEGENYLVPPGAKIGRNADIPLNAIRLSDLTRGLGGASTKTSLVVLDLARRHPFTQQGENLAPGLALVEPEPGMLVAFNAAPGTVAPAESGDYGAYALALGETMREGGLPLDEIFSRTRLRVSDVTQGAQLPWHTADLKGSFTFFERAPEAPAVAQTLVSNDKAIGDFPAEEAYAVALHRDTVKAYEAYLAAFPDSAYSKRVRGILTARREAITWRRTVSDGTSRAYWSYLKRYPKGPHVSDARHRLARLKAEAAPPEDFAEIEYDVGPPSAAENSYFVTGSAPHYYDSDAPASLSSSILPPRPKWWTPPAPPSLDQEEDAYILPAPATTATPEWIRPPAGVALPPLPYVETCDSCETTTGISPYIAVPAAVAVAVAAGAWYQHHKHHRPHDNGKDLYKHPPEGDGSSHRPPRPQPPVTAPPGTRPGLRPTAPPPPPVPKPSHPLAPPKTVPFQPPVIPSQGHGPQRPSTPSVPRPQPPASFPGASPPPKAGTFPTPLAPAHNPSSRPSFPAPATSAPRPSTHPSFAPPPRTSPVPAPAPS